MTEIQERWWKETIVYQIYPRSFKDSTGNGVGDLKGILNKVDYLEELGIETIWFSPFFVSPQGDHGYDIQDYKSIDPEYGTMKEFEDLRDELHKRKMKIVLDLVLNHTSDQHHWFLESSSSKDNPKRDWYIWKDGRKPNGKKPPNNWKAEIGGSAWRYFENTDQWVYHQFLPFQPDLNYRNPEVKKEMFDIVKFWLNKGADGFRLDIFHAIYEDKEFRDNPFTFQLLPSDESTSSFFQKRKYDVNQPETYEFAIELRNLIDSYKPERFLVGEVFGTIPEIKKYYGPQNNGLNMIFLFKFTSTGFDADKFRTVISEIEKEFPKPYIPTYVLGNHDRMRYISRLKGDKEKAKILATLQITLRGVPFIYYGEEIGMKNVKIKLKNSKDPIGRKFSWLPFSQIKSLGFALTRDGCRTPMQWDKNHNAGFSPNETIEPWLKIPSNYQHINVQTEKTDPNSLLNFYKSLIKIRRESPALSRGEFEFLDILGINDKCLGYKRKSEEQTYMIYLNFTEKTLKIPISGSENNLNLILSTDFERKNLDVLENSYFELKKYEGVIIDKKK
ncbi:MAG: Oligo-1,6-glucosidase [Promethearchaeota archaeon]|nr:MAG: Oligo-1,6-glucosidase [Candidatus Lokiarchaeota archaeon]